MNLFVLASQANPSSPRDSEHPFLHAFVFSLPYPRASPLEDIALLWYLELAEFEDMYTPRDHTEQPLGPLLQITCFEK